MNGQTPSPPTPPHGRVAGAALVLALVALGCARGADGWTRLDEAALAPSQRAQLAEAAAARDAMAGELMGKLTAELEASGPAGAIGVCRDAAPAIAAATAERLDVRIGRTSFKLRNPANAAPAWAEPLLADRPEAPRYAVGPDGELGVTYPMRILGACLACHGPAEDLAPDVRAALVALYPDDRATGFHDGDLRGWFWVEIPAR